MDEKKWEGRTRYDKKLEFFSLFRKNKINFFFTTPDKSIWASFTMRYYVFFSHFYYLIDKAMAWEQILFFLEVTCEIRLVLDGFGSK